VISGISDATPPLAEIIHAIQKLSQFFRKIAMLEMNPTIGSGFLDAKSCNGMSRVF
jgi:hypothetical protein